MKSGFFIIGTLILIGSTAARADDVSFSASVDRTTVGADEQFTLQFELKGAGMAGGKNLKLPDMSKFMILQGPSQSSNVEIINGAVSSSVTYSYVLQPREVGRLTIGAATIEAEGKRISSQPVEIAVVKGAPKQRQPAAGGQPADTDVQVGDNLFLRAVVDRSRVYLGEQIIVTFKVYTRVSITNYSINKLPAMTGFWGEDLAVPQQVNLTSETINGKQYKVGILKKMALFPTQAGTLEVNPLEIVCQVQVQNRRRSNDWFDQFFNDPFFNNFTTSNVGVKSLPLKIAVLPLPKADVPPSFRGAVGKFTLNTTLSSRAVKTNEPLTLKATISGAGNIKILEAPNVEIPNEFEKYDPKVTESIDRGTNVINGSKTFEWLLVPRYPGQKRIPPMEFSYFDASRGKYVTVHSSALDLSVSKGSAEAPQIAVGISKEDVKLLSQDIRFIKTAVGSFRQRGGEVISTPALALMTVLPLMAFVGLVAYRQKSLKELSELASFRSRKAIKVAQKRLKDAKALLTSNNAEQFYAETSKALWVYVSDKLSIDRAELSIENVVRQLESVSMPAGLIAQLRECLEACEFARFAPASATQEEKEKIFAMAGDVIVATEKGLNR